MRDLLRDYVTKPELAESLSVSVRTLDRMVAEPDGIPFVNLRGRILFHLPSVIRWLEGRQKQRSTRRQGRRAPPAPPAGGAPVDRSGERRPRSGDGGGR